MSENSEKVGVAGRESEYGHWLLAVGGTDSAMEPPLEKPAFASLRREPGDLNQTNSDGVSYQVTWQHPQSHISRAESQQPWTPPGNAGCRLAPQTHTLALLI